MGAITFNNFGGMIPRLSPNFLPDNAAQTAINCRLLNGDLIPYRLPKRVADCVENAKTIYRLYDNDDYTWLSWDKLVNVVKAPLFGTARWCITGDGAPKITTLADAKLGQYFTLGVPSPTGKPSVSPSGGVGQTISRYYAYSFYTKWGDVELEGGVSPLSNITTGKEDGTWAVSGMDASPANSGSCTAVYSSGHTTVTTSAPHWLRAGDRVILGASTAIVESVVSSTAFTVAGDYSSVTTWARKDPFPGTFFKRLYRSTGTKGQFQLVAEGITETSYIDTLSDGDIPGDELISSDWDMPPVELTGVVSLPSGALAGFVGNKLYFSEPNQPHAWLSAYTIQLDYPIIAIAPTGFGLAVGTTSTPYIINGIEPGQMQAQAGDRVLPCRSAASMVSIGDGALYASDEGLIVVTQSGIDVWTSQYFSKFEFFDLAPSTMISSKSSDSLFVYYDNDYNAEALVFCVDKVRPSLSKVTISATALFTDPIDGKLYFANGNGIYIFNPDDTYNMQQTWISKKVVLPKPTSLGAAKIAFDLSTDLVQYRALMQSLQNVTDVNGSWNRKKYNTYRWNGSSLKTFIDMMSPNIVVFKLFTLSERGELKLLFAKNVSDQKVFRLPSGYKVDTIFVSVESTCPIKRIELGSTPMALAETPL